MAPTPTTPFSPVTGTRRDFLWRAGGGLGGVALSALLADAGMLHGGESAESAKRPHHPARAQRVIQIFCPGGLSHVDSWDYAGA